MTTNPPVAVSGEDEEVRSILRRHYGDAPSEAVTEIMKVFKSYKNKLKTPAVPKLTAEEKLKHRRMNALPWGVVHCNRCNKEVGGPSQFTVFLGENPKDDYSAHTPCLTDEERAKAQKEGLHQ